MRQVLRKAFLLAIGFRIRDYAEDGVPTLEVRYPRWWTRCGFRTLADPAAMGRARESGLTVREYTEPR